MIWLFCVIVFLVMRAVLVTETLSPLLGVITICVSAVMIHVYQSGKEKNEK